MGRHFPSLKQGICYVQSWLAEAIGQFPRRTSVGKVIGRIPDSECRCSLVLGTLKRASELKCIGKFVHAGRRNRWEGFVSELDRLHGELGQTSGLAEPDFALLASNLGKVHQSTSTLREAVDQSLASVLTRIEAIRLGGDDGAASQTLAELRRDLGQIEGQVGNLEITLERIGKLQYQSAEVRRIGSFLTACSLNFAVECARQSQTAQEFTIFCQDLRALAGSVTQAGTQFGDECAETHSAQTRAMEKLHVQLSEVEQLIAPTRQTVSTTTQETQALIALIRQTLDLALAESAQITCQAHEALFHLQLGDIVRQKCEHVTHAIGIAKQRAQELAGTGCQGGEAAEIHQILAVQIGQLQQMRREITGAHSELSEIFGKISSFTSRLAGHTSSITTLKGAGSSTANPFESLQAALNKLETIQGRGEALRSGARELAGQASQSIGRLAEQLHTVRRINAEIHLQSLNAIIRTCHLGDNGQTLGVLAMHMHHAFQDSNVCVQNVIATLNEVLGQKSLSEPGDGLGSATEGSNSEVSKSFYVAAAEIADLYVQLHEAAKMAIEVAQEQDVLISGVHARLGFLSDLNTKFSILEEDLNSLLSNLEPDWVAGPESATVSTGLDQQYTMESEREIHRRIMQAQGIAVSEAVPSGDPQPLDVEFFDMPCPPADSECSKVDTQSADERRSEMLPATLSSSDTTSDLGDNVELF